MSFGINSNHNMNFIKLNKYVIISSILLISAIVSNLFLSYYIIPKRYIGVDQLQHFYDMKKWYVNFYNNGVLISHCFEDDEKQAKHFASLVNGTVYRG